MHQCIKFILFWKDTLLVSDGLSIHHQEFKTVHTATGICQTDTAVSNLFYFGKTLYLFRTVFPSIIRSSRLYIRQQAFVKQILLSPIYFILERHSTSFGRSFRPSSEVQDCTYSNRHLSNRYCCLLASKLASRQIWYIGASSWFYCRNVSA